MLISGLRLWSNKLMSLWRLNINELNDELNIKRQIRQNRILIKHKTYLKSVLKIWSIHFRFPITFWAQTCYTYSVIEELSFIYWSKCFKFISNLCWPIHRIDLFIGWLHIYEEISVDSRIQVEIENTIINSINNISVY